MKPDATAIVWKGLYLFAGAAHAADMESCLRLEAGKLSNRMKRSVTVIVECVDLQRGGKAHEFDLVLASPPCNTFRGVLFSG